MDNNQFDPNNRSQSNGSFNSSQTGSYDAHSNAGNYNAYSQQNNYQNYDNNAQQYDQSNNFNSQQYNQPNDFGNNGGYVPPQGNGAYQPNGKMPFYKTTKGIIIIALALVLVLGVVYWGYNNIFGFTKIDLAKNISLNLTGESGTATASSINVKNTVDYDKSNEKASNFVKSISYRLNKYVGIKNGDKIKVTVIFSESLAKECKVKVTNAEKTVTVSGLAERFEDGSKVSSEVASKMKTDADTKMQQMASSINGTTWEATPTFHSMYLAKTTSGNDYAIAVYDLKLLYKQTNKSVHYYVYTYCMTGINSNYAKNAKVWSGYTSVSIIGSNLYGYGNFIQTSDHRLISDESMIESNITNYRLFTGRTISKINA